MKKQKKAIVASILASATMLTITAAASTQNISAYTEAKDMLINMMDHGLNYENTLVKSNFKVTDENGTVIAEDVDESAFYSNGEYYYTLSDSTSYYFENESYEIYPKEKVAVRSDLDLYAKHMYDGEVEEAMAFSLSFRKFISVFIDTMVPDDVKSQFKKSSDGMISVSLNKNQIPELAMLGFDVICEEYRLDGGDGNLDNEYDPVFAGMSDAYIENVTLKFKGTDGIAEYVAGEVKISGVDESGNAIYRTTSGEVNFIPNGDATMQLPDLTGYKVYDEDATFEGTAIFTKGDETYEVTAEEAYNSRMRAYRVAYSKANNGDYPTNDLELYTTYFDTVTFPDGKDAYIQK